MSSYGFPAELTRQLTVKIINKIPRNIQCVVDRASYRFHVFCIISAKYTHVYFTLIFNSLDRQRYRFCTIMCAWFDQHFQELKRCSFNIYPNSSMFRAFVPQWSWRKIRLVRGAISECPQHCYLFSSHRRSFPPKTHFIYSVFGK